MSAVEIKQAPQRSLSGSVAAIGGLVTAIGGLLTILWQIGVLGSSGGTAVPTVTSVPAAPTVTARSAQVIERPPPAATSSNRVYAEQLARMLRNSADTRSDLGTLIGGVQNNSLAYTDAKARIAAVISQRQGLRDDVARLDTPAAFAGAAELLRRSLTAAIDDDVAVQRWIVAHYEGDPAAEGPAWQEQIAASDRATAAKRAFLEAYGRLAARGGNLPTLPDSY
jgi:hypothetical protein